MTLDAAVRDDRNGHLLPDSEDYLRGLLDEFDLRVAANG
jgi:hypothetical protein